MRILSSPSTFFIKRILPVLWFGVVFVVFMGGSMSLLTRQIASQWPLLVVPLVMLALGYVLFRKLVWDLADEVEDGGSYLVVRRGAIEQRVALENIMNVSVSAFTNPRRLTLRLRQCDALGDEVAFIPRGGPAWNPFARNPVAEDLMLRVDRLRGGGKSA